MLQLFRPAGHVNGLERWHVQLVHWCLAAALGMAACRPRTVATPATSPAPAAPACPAPQLRGVEWVLADDSTGFTVALPPGFEERPWEGPSRRWDLGPDFQQSMIFGTIRGDLGLAAYRRPYQPALMPEYSECTETVAGYQVSIQSFRTPNGTFRNYRRLDRYDVFAIWEIAPGVYGYISGGTYLRPTQDLMLGAIRSWRRAAGADRKL